MNDAISRSAAIEALDQHSYETSCDYDKTVELLNELPALDVAPVVRCKHCESALYDDGMQNDGVVYCCEWRTYVDCDGYCSEGERAEDDT